MTRLVITAHLPSGRKTNAHMVWADCLSDAVDIAARFWGDMTRCPA